MKMKIINDKYGAWRWQPRSWRTVAGWMLWNDYGAYGVAAWQAVWRHGAGDNA